VAAGKLRAMTGGSAEAEVGNVGRYAGAAVSTYHRGPGRARRWTLRRWNLRDKGGIGIGEPSRKSLLQRLLMMSRMGQHHHENAAGRGRGPPDVMRMLVLAHPPPMRKTGLAVAALAAIGTATTRAKWSRRNRRRCDQ